MMMVSTKENVAHILSKLRLSPLIALSVMIQK